MFLLMVRDVAVNTDQRVAQCGKYGHLPLVGLKMKESRQEILKRASIRDVRCVSRFRMIPKNTKKI